MPANMNEKKKSKKSEIKKIIESKQKYSNISSFILIIVLIIIAGIEFSLFYSYLTDRIIKFSIQNMEEISEHDKKSVYSSIEYRWVAGESIGTEFKQSKFQDTSTMLKKLNLKCQTLEGIDVSLVTDTGKVYTSNYAVTEDKELLELFEKYGDRFVVRRDNTDTKQDYKKEQLLVGSKIEPFTIGDNRFEYIVSYYDIAALQNELKIDSYNGQGYSSVIDSDGNFIVYISNNNNLFVRENFYTRLQDADLKSGMTIEEIRNGIESKESFSIEYSSYGEDYV